MNKIILNYDGTNLYTPDGAMITAWTGLQGFDPEDAKPSLSSILKLKEAGFDHDQIIEMHKAGLL